MEQIKDGRGSGLAAAETPTLPEVTSGFDAEDLEPRPLRMPGRRGVTFFLMVVLGLTLAVLVPPLLNMNRFRRETASSISASLGRPVHMDALTLNILPMPGFTLTNFVVSEDPAFGAEPVMRANTVRARLRIASLWRRRVEFSRISLDEPSVNLVRRLDGRWNIESILLQASKIEAAPTAQQRASGAPRFPYIEATGARVNLKTGLVKMPISLTDAEFALWLPQPQQWKLRLKGNPTRTDAAPANSGLLQVQGTLGKAARMAEVPVELTGEWSAAPLGAVSTLLTGRDAGFRGELTLRASVSGTLGENRVESRLQLGGVHRADFVPARMLEVDLGCAGVVSGVFTRVNGLHCSWPSAGGGVGAQVTGEVPDLQQPRGAELTVKLKDVPASELLDGVRIASERVAPALVLGGKVSGEGSCCAAVAGTMLVEGARLALAEGRPFVDAATVEGRLGDGALTVGPMAMDLGGVGPAMVEGRLDQTGFGMHLSGPVLRSRVQELARALPQFGDGLVEMIGDADQPIRVDLMSSRGWTGGQAWRATTVERAVVRRRRR